MGRKKRVRNGKRVTIYMDERLEEKMRALAKRAGMSLSSATRLLYVISLGFGRIVDDMQQWFLEIQTVYPDGVPEEEAAAFMQRFTERLVEMGGRWARDTHLLLVGAGFPGMDPEPPTTMSAKQLFDRLSSDVEGIQKLGALLRDEEVDRAEPTVEQAPAGAAGAEGRDGEPETK